MQKILYSVLSFVLLLIYWSVHDTVDEKLFGPTQAPEIATPDRARYPIDVYPQAKVKEKELEHDEEAALWRYRWLLEAPYGTSNVVDFYKRRMGEPKASQEEEFAYEEVIFEKEPPNAAKGELTRVFVVPNEENPDHALLVIDQYVGSGASTLSWKTRRNVTQFVILGTLVGALALGGVLLKKFTAAPAAVEAPVQYPPVAQRPEPAPAAPPAPALDDSLFFQEVQARLAHEHPDWKASFERFDLTVRRPGKAPVTVDAEPLYFLWRRPGVDREQAIATFLARLTPA